MPAQDSLSRLLRILLIEHNGDDAVLCIRALEKLVYPVDVDIATGRDDFQSRMRLNSYDIVISDYHMPEWTGLDALSALRSIGSDAPFILVAGVLGDEFAVECIKQGVTDYVSKDHLTRLPIAIERALGERLLRRQCNLAEEMQRRSETGLQLLFTNNPLPMYVYDLQTFRFLQVNDAAVAFYGFSHDEFSKMSFFDLRDAESDAADSGPEADMFQTVWFSGEWRHRKKNGDIAHVYVVRHLIQLYGRDAGLSVVQDITARKSAEQSLRASESRNREFLEHTPYGVYRASIFGKFSDVNPALVKMLRYSSAAELIAQPLTAIYEKTEDADLLVSQYAESGVVNGVEIPWKRKDGVAIYVRLAGRAVPDSTGNPLSLEIIVQDVTERRELEKQLRQAQKFEAIGQLAGGIAHDFNNVLGAVIGWAELGVEQSKDRTRIRDYFKKIVDQASRAAGLTRQLLAFARRQVLAPQDIQINGVVNGISGLLESILGKNITLETRLSAIPTVVRADPTQMEQVLMNLCLNARDAMPQGGKLTIATKVSNPPAELHIPGLPVGRYVQLIVTDTGSGMDSATREHIFEPFFTTKEPGKGTGLGLATVFGIVNQHDGFIRVDSEIGHGSTFEIALPCASVEPRRVTSPERPREITRGGTEALLLAEDHEGVREIARVALERAGYRVLLANDGLNAAEQFRRNPSVALVVMDLVMPRMGGHAAIAQMRESRPDLPVIFTTGYTAEAAAIANLREDRDVVLQKPYEACLLLRHVRELLDRRSLHHMLDSMASDVLLRHSEGP